MGRLAVAKAVGFDGATLFPGATSGPLQR